SSASDVLQQEVERELERNLKCRDILGNCLDNDNLKRGVIEDPDYWLHSLAARWKKERGGDLFKILRDKSEREKIVAELENKPDKDGKWPEKPFPLVPRELCILEREIATLELRDLYHSSKLSDDEFVQLVEALARGWGWVMEDAKSNVPE